MTYQFESPGRLEQRIAANMADESEDLSLGVGRRLSSFASISMETDDFSMSRSGPPPNNQSFQNTRQEQQSPWTNTSSKPEESFQNSQMDQESPWTSSSPHNSFQASRTTQQQSPWTKERTVEDSREIRAETKSPFSAQRQALTPIDSNKMEGTSTPKASRPDQERMKAYLINSVKTVNPLREAQIRHMTPRRRPARASLGRTPLPGPSRLRIVGGDDVTEETENESFLSDVSSTKDLTIPAKFAARANTSFPGIGAGDGAGASNARVDPVRLQGYLHKINIQLENENVSLKEEKEALKRQFNRALMDCESLREQIEAKEDDSGPSKGIDQGTMTHNDEIEELKREVERLQNGHDELNDLLDERDTELEAAQKMQMEAKKDDSKANKRVDQGTMTHNDEIEELRREVERLQTGQDELNDILDERDAELEAAQKDLEDAQKELEESRKQEDLIARIRELEEELAEEKEVSDQQRVRFEERIKQAMDEAVGVQGKAEEQLIKQKDDALKQRDNALKQRDNAMAQVEAIQLTSARTNESTKTKESTERGLLLVYEEKALQAQNELQIAREVQEDVEKRLEEEARAFDELEDDFEKVKEDLLRCEDELNGAKDQIMDLQIASEEKESDNIKLKMQLRQSKESDEVLVLREKVLLLEAQLEGLEQESVHQFTPIHKNISMLRKPLITPKSPAELSSASWLNQESSLGDKALLQYLQDLRKRVDEAHAQTDEKLAAGRKELWTDVASLERDLRRVREESERFGSDLEKLRAEQEVTKKRETKSDQRQTEQLHQLQQSIAIMQQREANLHGLHHAECKGLLLQIRYEKAKFMRESDLRSDVIQQKEYIVGILEGMEMVDTTTSRFLADIRTNRLKKQRSGTADLNSVPVAKRFKVVAHVVVAICRARIMAQNWRQVTDVKRALRDAHKVAKLIRQKPLV